MRSASLRTLVVLATAAAALAVAPPAAAVDFCNTLSILLVQESAGPIVMQTGDCRHGKYQWTYPAAIGIEASGLFGPDCRIGFLDTETGKMISVVEFQQNYCLFEAGAITVTTVQGKQPNFVAKEGSYGEERTGRVTISGFKD